MNKLKKCLAFLLAVVVFITISCGLGDFLMPQRQEYGCTWKYYLNEPTDTIDLIFVGSSLAYCDVIPAQIWNSTNLATYVVAGPIQTLPISYYYIKEACRTQSPSAIFLEVTGMFYEKYPEYTKVNIGYMPWGKNRIGATFEAAPIEERKGLLFPLYNYHYRIYDITSTEIEDKFENSSDILAGYTFLTESKQQSSTFYREWDGNEDNYQNNLSYLKKIKDFCAKENITLYCYITPTKCILNSQQLEKISLDVEAVNGEPIINFNEYIDKMNIDDNTDWYDELHFNFEGATKFSKFLSEYIRSELKIEPSNRANNDIWLQRVKFIESKSGIVTS